MARLNVQGLARRSPELMRCIVPDPGYIVASSDAAAGEPTVVAHFSADKNYYDATFGMVGKPPYYKEGVLKVDDLYLSVASVSPIGSQEVAACYRKTFNGLTFSDQWLKDPEIVKKDLAKIRKINKELALATAYGMGPRKMVNQMYERGQNLTMAQAKEFHRAYWTLFSDVKRFAAALSATSERQGYIVNPFGYRLTPEPHKAFNAFIQSSVSGIFHIFCAKLFHIAPYARFITVVHDEVLVEVPIDRQDDYRKAIQDVTDSINADLDWRVSMRFGLVFGPDWYEAK